MYKLNIILIFFITLDIFFIFFEFEQNLFTQITLTLFILVSVLITLKLNLDLLKNPIYNFKDYIFTIICFIISIILILPFELKIRTISFNYNDCLSMIFSNLIATTTLSIMTINIYKNTIKKNKYISVITTIILLFNVLLLYIKSLFLVFGIYIGENFQLIYI